jgi:hypothetical protein
VYLDPSKGLVVASMPIFKAGPIFLKEGDSYDH